jgi:ankyrin repeat protein
MTKFIQWSVIAIGGFAMLMRMPIGMTPREEPFDAPVYNGDIPKMKQLLANDMDINAKASNGESALTQALDNGNFKMAEFLFQNGAKLDRTCFDSAGSSSAEVWILNALEKEAIQMADLLHKLGPRLNPETTYFKPALSNLKKSGSTKVKQWLAKHGV